MSGPACSDSDVLQRLRALDELLPTLADVLDVREVFQRVADIARRVVPHEMAALMVVGEDSSHVTLHAVSNGALTPSMTVPVPNSLRARVSEPWDHWIIADVQDDPLTREGLTAKAGFRGVLRVAIRVSSMLVAILEFSSRTPNAYDDSFVLVARRVADHLALALSHERLAEERKRAAALEERTANLELLDGLLKALSASLDIRQVFEQVSSIARKVIPHDMVSLPLISDNREHVVIHAVAGNEATFPTTVPLPDHLRPLLTEPWEYLIHRDLQEDPLEKALPPGQAGYRGHLLVPIRLQDQLVGALDFFSFRPGAFTKADVLVARRIADQCGARLVPPASRRNRAACRRGPRASCDARAPRDGAHGGGRCARRPPPCDW